MKILERFLSLFRPKSDLYLIGSSILWGQGHKPASKIDRKIAAFIRKEFKECPTVHLMAHSGAMLSGGPSSGKKEVHGEVPTPWPSVHTQVRTAPQPRSKHVRIFVEGGINDVGGMRISSPTTSKSYLEKETEKVCYHDFKRVLSDLLESFPRAEVYVLGYYQILAEKCEDKEVKDMLERSGAPPVETEDDFDLAERAIENTRLFRELSDHYLKKACDETVTSDGASCTFVASGFDEGDGMFAKPSLLFHPWSSDPMMAKRAEKCTVALAKGQTGLHCYLAATAHPNEAGIERYVAQITAALRDRSHS